MIQSFTAQVKTEFDTYYIDYKPDNQPNNRFAVSSYRRTAVYLDTLQDAYNQIEFYYDQDMDRAIEQANLLNELEHNQ
jgi:hypothetical protein